MSKAQQRKAALAARRALGEEGRQRCSEAVCKRLASLPEVRSAGVVLSYVALPDEVDLSYFHERYAPRRLCFPVTLPGGVMEAWEPRNWVRGPHGIWEPDRACSVPVAPEEIDLVIVPCVAFDEAGRRLGHGAGYYDRFLATCLAPGIAVAFEAQKLDWVETEVHDRTMDAVVTERTVYPNSKFG